MKRFTVFLLATAGLIAGVLLIGLMVPAVPVAADPNISIQVNYGHDWVNVNTAAPFTDVTVTLSDNGGVKGTYNGQTDGDGNLFTQGGGWDPDGWVQILPGDAVAAATDSDSTSVDPVGVINGVVDLEADTVAGTIEASWFATVDVTCEIWEEDGPDSIHVPGVSGDGGSYSCDFSSTYDIKPGHMLAVRYDEPDGDQVINMVEPPAMQINYAHDWVGGNYPAGHTFTITVKDSLDVVKATAVVESTPGGGGGSDGFQTQGEDWSPERPDIMAGDSVMFESDDDYSNTVTVGDIGGTLDLVGNKISGPINASWLSETLPVECHPWGAPGGADNKHSTATPDGANPYNCVWDPLTEWKIKPGQDIAVMYFEPDADSIINVFHEPAPDLRMEKWAEGSGQAAPGQPVIFTIRYRNEGDAVAQTITITDTMPVNTTYNSDSSGATPAEAGSELVWALGPLDPGEDKEFYLVLDNSAAVGDKLLNKVEGTTPFDPNDENNYADAWFEIVDGQPDLYVNKRAEPWDPAPGQTFKYRINYGNNGPVASGPVTLTDMLPQGVTFVSWYSREGYNLWNKNSSGGNFILEAASIPGHWSDTIELRVKLDAGVNPGTNLLNKVTIETANDSDPDNNQSEADNNVGEPRWDGRMEKQFNWGILAPEGEVDYHLSIDNDGNMATGMIVTDMMPVGTSFEEAWSEVNGERVPFPPDKIDGRELTWNLGSFEPGHGQNIDLRLTLDDVEKGDIIVNCATVTIDGDDQKPADNTSCVEEMIHEAGANLRVTKRHWWHNEDRIQFTIRVENNGTTTLRDVEIVDTYPKDTHFNDEWWSNYWRELKFAHNAAERKLVWEVEELHPGDSFDIDFNVDVDGAVIGKQGLAFTNIVEAPVPHDVYPANNSDEDTAYSGPNLFVKKWLKSEWPNPGDVVIFVVEFGNTSYGHWGTSDETGLVDTLGEGMTFISATDPDDPDRFWLPKLTPEGKLLWEWGHMGSDNRWRFEMKVKIDDDVDPGTMLTNEIEVFSESQEDIDPVPENNVDSVTFQAGRVIYLPIIMKS